MLSYSLMGGGHSFTHVVGVPQPDVTWWRGSHLIDSTFETTFGQTVQNTLTLPKVQRADLGSQITCQAKNNNISIPVRNTVTIDLKCKCTFCHLNRRSSCAVN